MSGPCRVARRGGEIPARTCEELESAVCWSQAGATGIRPKEAVVRARRLVLAVVIGAAGIYAATAANDPDEMTLYDWMYPASAVVAGRVLDEAGKLTDVQVDEVFRGEIEPGSVIGVNVKKANRYREDFQHRLKLDGDHAYLFLLKPVPPDDPGDRVSYLLVRGVNGTREIPPEGASAFLDATRQLAQLQAVNSDELHWHTLGRMLEENNRYLLLTALDEFLKFRRENPELVLRGRPLLQHPRPDIRQRALELCGRILARFPRDQVADAEGLEMEIIGLARRDPSPDVRIAATHALAGLADASVEEVWEEISQDDPDQRVRYAAERLLYEHRIDLEARSGGNPH